MARSIVRATASGPAPSFASGPLYIPAVVAATTAGAYEGPMAKLGAGPEAVARTIERAISRRRPRTRYPVTASARVLLAQHALLPDRLWDAVVGTSFPRPRP